MLSELDIGPMPHFVGYNAEDFYIATEDLSQFRGFEMYDKIFRYLPSPTPGIMSKCHVRICNELLKMNVISREFRLLDTTINKSNFGFCN